MNLRANVLGLFSLIVLTGCGGGGGSTTGSPPPVTPLAATVTSIVPASVSAGAPDTALQITGTNFVSGSVATLNGRNLATTFVSATSLSATIPASSLTTGATDNIAVDNAGAAASATVVFLVNSPVPTLTSASPTVLAIDASAVLTLTGTGFEPTSAVQLNGLTVNSTFVDSTTLTASFGSSNPLTPGNDQVTVVNPAPAGGTSAAVTLQVTQPTPVIQSVSPASIFVGSGTVTVTITGASFTPDATVTANGAPLAVSAQTTTSITVVLPAPSTAQTGPVTLIVTNPGVNQESSQSQTVAVVTTPALYQIFPSGSPIGGPDQTVTLYGKDFAPGSLVEWNGTALSTTYQSPTALSAIVPALDTASFNSASVTVSTPIDYPAMPRSVVSSSVPFSTYLALLNNDIAYNALDGLLYASVPGAAPGNLGNSIVGFDPIDGNIVKTIPVGSEPGQIAISSDGTRLFVGLNGSASVREVNLTTSRAGIQFSLGPGNSAGTPQTVEAIAALPGEPDSVAVLDNNGVVTIFDSGVARARTSLGIVNGYANQSTGSLSFGPTASSLYVSSYLGGLYALTLDATGVAAGAALSTNINGGPQLQYDSGRLYVSNGTVLDASTANQLGQLSISPNQVATGPVVSDSTLGLAFVANTNNTVSNGQLTAFNEATFNPTGSIPLNQGGFLRIVRWGQDGLAASNPTNIYVVQSPIVKDLGSSPADLAVQIAAPATAATGSAIVITATVTNSGPHQAQGITFNSTVADNLIVQSVKPSQGACASGSEVSCNLGSLADGAAATVTIDAIPSTSGTIQSTAVVSSVSFDPAAANNQATSSTTVTGSLYGAVPQVAAISPSLVQAGSASFTLTVTGSGFNSSSIVQIGGQARPTTLVDNTTLTANIDASEVASYGWAAVTVANPSPGGGVSQVAPLTIYALLNVPANAIAFDPFTRNLYAALPSTSTPLTGNSLVAIDPATGKIGTPIAVGSEPNVLAETSDGNYLYIGLSGADSLGRFNLLTQSLDATIPIYLAQYSQGGVAAASIAAMPGSDSTIAIDTSQGGHLGIFDISGKAGTFRPNLGVGDAIFLDAAHLAIFDYGFLEYDVDANGLTPRANSGSNLSVFNGLGAQGTVLSRGLLYGVGGGIADPSSTPASQIAELPTFGLFGIAVAPDPANSLDFLVLENVAGTFGYSLSRYNTTQYLSDAELTLPVGQNGGELGYNMLRWGQDGLALRSYGDFGNSSSTGQVLLIRGPFVLPSELNANSAPQLTNASQATLPVNSGNTILTLTGSGFLPGAVVLWNGSPRTTTFVSATQLGVDIAAADLAAPGSDQITAENPNSAASGAVTVVVK
ncbi:MAG TPA: IPT/TIG domain-containing protein [Acidisarcina sp.]